MPTAIEWTDETWNPVTGCERISPGCAHCYAKALHDMRHKAYLNGHDVPEQYSEPFEVVKCHEDRLDTPMHWRAPRMCFVNSMSDLFHEDVPEPFIDRVFAAMSQSPAHTFQILTKRADRMLRYLDDQLRPERIDEAGITQFGWCHANVEGRWPLPNVWPGVSVENKRYLPRLDALRQVPAPVRMVSFEPLLEDLTDAGTLGTRIVNLQGIGWAIIGGESGDGARDTQIAWVRYLIEQCDAQGVPLFVKQVGARPVDWADFYERWPRNSDGSRKPRVIADGHFLSYVDLRDRKGGDPEEWPQELRRRELPKPYPGHEVIRLKSKRKEAAA
jgi:protein gp37